MILAQMAKIGVKKREFLAHFRRGRRKTIYGGAFSRPKNSRNSQISIVHKWLKIRKKHLIERKTFGGCQKCEYLTLLNVFARDKCCD